MRSRNIHLIFWPGLVALVLWNYLFYQFATTGGMVLFMAIKTALIFLLIICLVSIMKRGVRLGVMTGRTLAWQMTLLFLLILELAFTFVAKSHHAEVSYASLVWQHRYYHLNDDGFRDEPIAQKDHDKPALVFLGDSFTAGLGTNDPGQRFSNRVHDAMADSYEFYNIGQKATGPEMQRKHLGKVPNAEKILVYQAFVNDLDDFCDRRLETHSFDIYQNFSPYDRYWSKGLFLLNYIYFSFPNQSLIEGYYDFYQGCVNDPEVFMKYQHSLLALLTSAHEELGYRRIVLLYVPTLADLSFGEGFKEHLAAIISTLPYVTMVDADDQIAELPVPRRIVNRQDTHAGKIVQDLFAEKLLTILNKEL